MFMRCPFLNQGNLEDIKLHKNKFLRKAQSQNNIRDFFFGFSGLFLECRGIQSCLNETLRQIFSQTPRELQPPSKQNSETNDTPFESPNIEL